METQAKAHIASTQQKYSLREPAVKESYKIKADDGLEEYNTVNLAQWDQDHI